MALNELFDLLACPKCKGALTLSTDELGAVCEACLVVYPIREGVPHLLVEEATALPTVNKDTPGEISLRKAEDAQAVFLVVEGKQKGEEIRVDQGTCRAIGRSVDEVEKTKIFNFDPALALDEASKKLVMQYLSTQFKKDSANKTASHGAGQGVEHLGGFLRGPDVQVRDISISRLHAMIFYDESGAIGILDLVSKNGTFVNGAEVESRLLKSGDLIALGSTKLRLQ